MQDRKSSLLSFSPAGILYPEKRRENTKKWESLTCSICAQIQAPNSMKNTEKVWISWISSYSDCFYTFLPSRWSDESHVWWRVRKKTGKKDSKIPKHLNQENNKDFLILDWKSFNSLLWLLVNLHIHFFHFLVWSDL